MKKIILILSLCLIPFVCAKEETILLLDSPVTTINYAEDDNSLINVKNMKKASKIESAQEKFDENIQGK